MADCVVVGSKAATQGAAVIFPAPVEPFSWYAEFAGNRGRSAFGNSEFNRLVDLLRF